MLFLCLHDMLAASHPPTPLLSLLPCPAFSCWQAGGDIVEAVPLPGRPGEVVIDSIEGDGGRLGLDAKTNCVGVAARATLELLGIPRSAGVALKLFKGLPLGSGLGSSAASGAAAAAAVNALFGSPLTMDQLVPAGLASEAAVSGFHADNVAPALMGGFVLIR
jgi:homoserine kinase